MKTIFQIFFRDLKRLLSNWVAVIVLLGVCVIPSLYAWFNIAANMDPYSNTQGILIAVANCDKGTDHELVGELNVGDEIIKNLKENDALGWTFTDRQSAIDGVEAGDYYAAIVIPEDFSQSMVSVLSGNIHSPEIEYFVNEKKNAIAPKVTDTGATTVQQQVNQTFVSVASEAVSEILDETILSVSENLGAVNRKSASTVRKAAQELNAQQDVLKGLDKIAKDSKEVISGARKTLKKTERIADEGAGTIDLSLDTLAAVRQSVSLFSIQLEGAIAQGDRHLSEIETAAGEDLSDLQSELAKAEAQLTRLITKTQAVIDRNEANLEELKRLNSLYPNAALETAVEALEKQKQRYQEILQSLEKTLKRLEDASDLLLNTQTSVYGALQAERKSLSDAKNILNTDVFPVLNRTLDVLAIQGGTLSGILSSMEPTMVQLRTILDELDNCVDETRNALTATASALKRVSSRVDHVADEISALRSADSYSAYEEFLQDRGLNAKVVADFISSPVQLTTVSLFPVKNYGSAMTPFYTNLAIWVSGIVLIAIFKLEVDRDKKLKKITPTQAYFGRWLLFIAVGLIQAVIICLGDIFLLKTQCEHPLAFIGAGMFISFVYVNLIYALSLTFKHIGKAVCVILVILQIPGSAGTYPIEMTPAFFRNLHPLLPFTYGINAMREAIAGMYGHLYWKNIACLALYLPIALLVGLGVRLLMLNLNRMFDKKLEETGLMICEENGMTRERLNFSSALEILAGQEEFRDKMIQKAEQFEENYRKLKAAGILLILILPLVFLILMFSVSSKMVFLVLWIASIVAVVLYLIIIEFLHDSLERKLRFAEKSKDELITSMKGRA